jgi:hypothetical protein
MTKVPKALIDVRYGLGHNEAFWAARGKAVQAFAILEQEMCRLYAYLEGLDFADAAELFFEETFHQGKRRQSLLKGMRAKHGSRYDTFFESLIEHLRCVTNDRNKVVHWHSTWNFVSVGHAELAPVVRLRDPKDLDVRVQRTEPRPSDIGIAELKEFIDRCNFFSLLTSLFIGIISGSVSTSFNAYASWAKPFDEEVTYPPPPEHPLG